MSRNIVRKDDYMHDNTKKKNEPEETNIILKDFFAPIITGIVMSIVMTLIQWFLEPTMERNKIRETQLWLAKKEVFFEAMSLIDKKIDSDPVNFPNHIPTNEKPSTFDSNRIFSNLLLLSENKEIPETFRKFFENSEESRMNYSPADRGKFIVLIKKELTKENMYLLAEKVPMFLSVAESKK